MRQVTSDTECEWCSSPATATVHAQWSLVDFDEAYACDDHIRQARIRFWNRLVDGQRPVDLWATHWDVGMVPRAVSDSP